jgi:hypothetical protein
LPWRRVNNLGGFMGESKELTEVERMRTIFSTDLAGESEIILNTMPNSEIKIHEADPVVESSTDKTLGSLLKDLQALMIRLNAYLTKQRV